MPPPSPSALASVPLGHGLFWQDISVGQRFHTFGRTITETDIINFVNTTGMTEPLFVDAEYRRQHSALPGFAAPAALIYAIAEGLTLAGLAHGTGLAFLHTEIDVKGPTTTGDTIHVEIEVTEVRTTSKSPPGEPPRGLVRTRNTVLNQRRQEVMIYTPLRLVRGRPV